VLTIHDLLKDQRYRKFFCKVPPLPDNGSELPWRLAIQFKPHGPWATKDYATYSQAFKKLKNNLSRINDAAIISKAIPFEPPNRVVRIKGKFIVRGGKKIPVTKLIPWAPTIPADEFDVHHWCPYCRRPTVFKRFLVHPILTRRRLNGIPIDPEVERCSICGASSRLVDLKKH